MSSEDLEFVDSTMLLDDLGEQVVASGSNEKSRRANRRFELVTQASVSIPPMNAAAYEVREVSRGGMFLAFKEPGQILQVESANIGVASNAEIAFTVLAEGHRQQLSVRARIYRIERQGIAFQFLTRNPPQLAALRTLFSKSAPEMVTDAQQSKAIPVITQRRKIQRPPDDSGWQYWKLSD